MNNSRKKFCNFNKIHILGILSACLMVFTTSAMALSPYKEAKMGESNGCRDGSRYLSAAQSAYDDIMYNGAISRIYKESYSSGWATCRNIVRTGTIAAMQGGAYIVCFNSSTCSDFDFGKIVVWGSGQGGPGNPENTQ